MLFDIFKIKEMRQRLCLTQKQFANKAGVSQSIIAKIEAGRLDPSYSTVKKIEALVNTLTKEKEQDIKSLMTRKIICVEEKMSAHDVISTMNRHSISQVPVMDGNNVVGLITETSILNKSLEDMRHLSAKDIMVEPPPIVSEATKVSVVLYLLKSYPVVLVRNGGKVTGIVAKTDLLRQLL